MSQNQDILDYLWEGNTITPLEALEMFNCFRLASRINDLRREGYEIETRNVEGNGKKYAEYKLLGYCGEKSDQQAITSASGCRASEEIFGDMLHSAPPIQAELFTNSILSDKAS